MVLLLVVLVDIAHTFADMAGKISYVLVDVKSKAEDAIKDLTGCTQLSVDCEGVNLGRDGELCLLQIASPKQVYLFDIVALGSAVFELGKFSKFYPSGCLHH